MSVRKRRLPQAKGTNTSFVWYLFLLKFSFCVFKFFVFRKCIIKSDDGSFFNYIWTPQVKDTPPSESVYIISYDIDKNPYKQCFWLLAIIIECASLLYELLSTWEIRNIDPFKALTQHTNNKKHVNYRKVRVRLVELN